LHIASKLVEGWNMPVCQVVVPLDAAAPDVVTPLLPPHDANAPIIGNRKTPNLA
jgi:hypothetical protein